MPKNSKSSRASRSSTRGSNRGRPASVGQSTRRSTRNQTPFAPAETSTSSSTLATTSSQPPQVHPPTSGHSTDVLANMTVTEFLQLIRTQVQYQGNTSAALAVGTPTIPPSVSLSGIYNLYRDYYFVMHAFSGCSIPFSCLLATWHVVSILLLL